MLRRCISVVRLFGFQLRVSWARGGGDSRLSAAEDLAACGQQDEEEEGDPPCPLRREVPVSVSELGAQWSVWFIQRNAYTGTAFKGHPQYQTRMQVRARSVTLAHKHTQY